MGNCSSDPEVIRQKTMLEMERDTCRADLTSL